MKIHIFHKYKPYKTILTKFFVFGHGTDRYTEILEKCRCGKKNMDTRKGFWKIIDGIKVCMENY